METRGEEEQVGEKDAGERIQKLAALYKSSEKLAPQESVEELQESTL